MVVAGKRVRSRTVPTIEQAQRLLDSMREWKPGAATFTLGDAIKLLRDDLRRKGTTRFYDASFAVIRAAWPDETPLVRIDAPAIERWADIRRDVHGVSASTIAKNLGTLRWLFRIAVRRQRDTGVTRSPMEERSRCRPSARSGSGT